METAKATGEEKSPAPVLSAGEEQSPAPVLTAGEEQSPAPVLTAGEEQSPAPVLTAGEEQSPAPVLTAGEEQSPAPVLTAGEEQSPAPVLTAGEEQSPAPVLTAGEEQSPAPVLTAGEEQSPAPVLTAGEEQSPAPVLTAGEEQSPAPVLTAGEEQSPAPVLTAGEEQSPAPVLTAGEEQSPAPVLSAGEEQSPAPVLSAGEEKSPAPVLSAGEEKSPAPVLSAGEEQSPAPVLSAGEEPSPAPDALLSAEQNVGVLEVVLLRTKLGTETWNDRMKKLITGLVGLVHPEGIPIGSFISTLIGFFWPSSAETIWDLVKAQADYMIDQKILEAKVHQLSNNLEGLRQTMEQYVVSKPHEKGEVLGAIIASCNDLHSRLVNSDNAVNLIPLTVTLSYMHLANLKEQLMHGKEIYEEDNTEVWRKNLEKAIQTYKEDFQTTYAKWQEWRRDNIVVTLGEFKPTIAIHDFPVYTGEVNDKIPDEKRRFESTKSSDSNPTYFKEICDTVKAMLWKKANGAMLQTLLPTFFLDNFMPGNEDNPSNPDPSMLTAAFGPFSYNILEGSYSDNCCVYYPPIDNCTDNAVTLVHVRESNLVDGLQFNYKGSWGTFVGNLEGGQLHEVEAKGRLVQNVIFSFNSGGMVDIELLFSDGQSSGRLGNRGGLSVSRAEAGGIDSFGLKNVQMMGGSGVTQIELFYEHCACRPSDINTK